MVFVQSYKLNDLDGPVIWEFAITSNYPELFDSEDKREIDIIDFGDVKFEGDAADLSQKEDEFDFSAFESRIKTDDDKAAIDLLKTSEYSDVWVALFEYEPAQGQEFAKNQCDFQNRIFSGLIRRKISATDNIWFGDAFSESPTPMRDWKFTAQSLGEALLDSVKLASSLDENGALVSGALADCTIPYINCKYSGYEITYQDAVYFDSAVRALLEVAKSRISAKIPGFEITTRESQSGYFFGYDYRDADKVWQKGFKRVKLFAENSIDALFESALIDSRLIKFPVEDDKITPKLGYSIAWHRFENLTTLLYKLALCFGCQLRIYHTGKSGFEIAFEPIAGDDVKKITLFDATKASINLEEASISSSDKYYCQGTDVNNEGISFSAIENGEIISHDEIKAKSDPLPLAISCVYQWISRKGSYEFIFMNSKDSYFTAKECAWAGILLPLSIGDMGNYAIVTSVAATISGAPVWFKTLADCLNSKADSNNTYYKSEYSIEVPFIKSFKSIDKDSSLSNLALFKSIEIDGKTYRITSIGIKPMDGVISIKAANSDRYGFVQPFAAAVFGKAMPEMSETNYYEVSGVNSGVAAEDIIEGDLCMRRAFDSKIAHLDLKSYYYGAYCGVAANSAAAGETVFVKITGFANKQDYGLSAGKPVFARLFKGKVQALPNPLPAGSNDEQLNIKIGYAVDATTYRIIEPVEYLMPLQIQS